MPDGPERSPFALAERGGLVHAEPGFLRKRMMDERDDPKTAGFVFDVARHRAAGQTVYDHQHSVRDRCQLACCFTKRSRIWKRKRRADAPDLDAGAGRAKTFDDAAVVDVPAGRRIQITGNDEGDQGSYKRPSYDADATWDSFNVIFMLSTPCPLRPSASRLIASARRSKIVRASTSVVVFFPLSEGSSSRFL